MFGKVKKWLGIDGVQIELVLPETSLKDALEVNGKIRFFSKQDGTVSNVRVKMIERFSRGRGEEKMTDEYQMGEILLAEPFGVPADDPIELEFTLPFKLAKSEMDQLEEKNILFNGLIKSAKWLRGVKSTYRLEATCEVSGIALNPYDRKSIELI